MKMINSKFQTTKKLRSDALYFGFEFSVEELIKFVGGESEFKKGIKILRNIIDDEIKQRNKELSYSSKYEILYDEYATITGKNNSILIQYRINVHDDTGHSLAVAWDIDFNKPHVSFSTASGWDG